MVSLSTSLLPASLALVFTVAKEISCSGPPVTTPKGKRGREGYEGKGGRGKGGGTRGRVRVGEGEIE